MTVEGPSTTGSQSCAKCGAQLELSLKQAGLWVSCPSCGQPVLVRDRLRAPGEAGGGTASSAPVSFTPQQAGPKKRRNAWSRARVESDEQAETPAAPTPDPPRPPPPPLRAYLRWTPVLVLSAVGALAEILFAAVALPVTGTMDLLMAGFFGACLGFFLSSMAISAVRER
jgi:DNA-directed RNA polymerase subunit RPC12/RpoP